MQGYCATMHSVNLEDLRFFLSLTRYGKLSVAAERLGVEHTTIRRRVTALETALGKRLFDKTPRGWTLTNAGERLLPYAQRIEAESDSAQAAIADAKHRPRGTVRIVATDGFGASVIAPGIAGLQRTYPDIDVELVTTSHLLSYNVGEFDIAVTIHHPERPEFTARHLCKYELRLYASPSYLDRMPTIERSDDLAEHDIVWFVESLLDLPELKSAEDIASRARIVFRTTNLFAQVEAAASGLGLALVPSFLAHHDKRLRPVLHGEVQAQRNFWLIIPARLANTERVSAVRDNLIYTAAAARDRLVPAST